jgi:hypothetical protein
LREEIKSFIEEHISPETINWSIDQWANRIFSYLKITQKKASQDLKRFIQNTIFEAAPVEEHKGDDEKAEECSLRDKLSDLLKWVLYRLYLTALRD